MVKDVKKAVEKLRSLPYREGSYTSRAWGHKLHSLCSYPSKIKPAIAHVLIKEFTKPNDRVLDPFSGIGTIPLEACLQGRIGLASDLNPLAWWGSLAKTSFPSKDLVDAVINNIEKLLDDLDTKKTLANFPIEDEIALFFQEKTRAEILIVRDFLINSINESEGERQAALCLVGTCCAHILHGNRPYALSRRSHNVIPIPPKGEFEYKSLIKSLKEKIDRTYKKQLSEDYKPGFAWQGSAFEVQVQEQVDCIITSPPFYGTTDFLRQNRLRLWFCGWDYERQQKEKKNGDFLEFRKTMDDYSQILNQFYIVLKSNGLCIMHMGVVKNRDMAKNVCEQLDEEKWEFIDIVYENVQDLESHGRTARGATHTHQFLILSRK
jgi:DNA modification methylase